MPRMRRALSMGTALLAFAPLIASCAPSTPPSALLTSPRLGMPAQAERPCGLFVLPTKPTQGDLEAGYAARGAQLVACDAARQLAVETHAAEHSLEDHVAAQRVEAARSWWPW